jgi:hypothetical protein
MSSPIATDPDASSLTVRRLRIILARIGVTCTSRTMLEQRMSRYFDRAAQQAHPVLWSFLSSLPDAEDLSDGTGGSAAAADMDAWLHILDTDEVPPAAIVTPERAWFIGSFSSWEQTVADRRYTLFGNAGFLSKYTYATLERCHGVLSFHAVSMYDAQNHEIYVVVGSAGAGKTVTMLEGTLRRGLRVFSTEMTHVNFAASEDGPVFYKGSLYDNVRMHNLADFPEAATRLTVPAAPERADDPKVCLSFALLATSADRLVNPKVTFMFPRIEGERATPVVKELKEAELVKALYENASEMILRPRVYYDNRLAIGALDYPDAAQHRLEICWRLVREARVTRALSILAGPRDSMAGIP